MFCHSDDCLPAADFNVNAYINDFHTCTAQKVSLKIQTSNTAGQPVDYITSAQPLKPYIFCFTGTCK